MTKYTSNTPLRHGSDAEFRAWLTEYSEMLTAIGLIKTSDTGQIEIASAVRPAGVNAYAGYEIRRLADSLDTTAAIFLKFEYGNGPGVTLPGIGLTLGTGTNGAGELTGIVGSRFGLGGGSPLIAGAAPTYACMVDGAAGVLNKVKGTQGSNNYASMGSWILARTCDANGYPTPRGAMIIAATGTSTTAQSYRFETPAAVVSGVSSSISHFPLGVISTVEGEIPCYPIWAPQPGMIPVNGVLAYPQALVPGTDVTEIAIVGSRVRTFLLANGGLQATAAVAAYGLIWED